MGNVAVLLIILFCSELLLVDRVRCIRYLSKGEDVNLSTYIQNKSRDSYDCVDIHKQLSFKHPLLKNHTIDFQVPATPLYYRDSGKDFSMNITSFGKTEMCSDGTIPVRKRQALETKQHDTTNRPNTFLAIARTKVGRSRYAGGGCELKTNNPTAVGQQYSATRIRLQGGADSIEAGWRVDPALYGDSQPRFFIRTDASQTHCFGTRCPGFILTYHDFNLEFPMEKISLPGGPVWTLPCYIIRNYATGNWNLLLGKDRIIIGYWPSGIFTGLRDLADRVEWGGAAYSPPGTPLPSMGSGDLPTGSADKDGAVTNIQVLNEKGEAIDKVHIETYADNPKLYSVRDGGYPSKRRGHVILYGGPGHL